MINDEDLHRIRTAALTAWALTIAVLALVFVVVKTFV
jgi:hypothetical protein